MPAILRTGLPTWEILGQLWTSTRSWPLLPANSFQRLLYSFENKLLPRWNRITTNGMESDSKDFGDGPKNPNRGNWESSLYTACSDCTEKLWQQTALLAINILSGMYARNRAKLRQRVYEKPLYWKWTVWKSLLLRVMHYNSWEGQDANTGLNCSSLNPEVSPVCGGSRSLSCVRSGVSVPYTAKNKPQILFLLSLIHFSICSPVARMRVCLEWRRKVTLETETHLASYVSRSEPSTLTTAMSSGPSRKWRN